MSGLDCVDFRYLVLEYYKKLGISEQELVILLMINHLLNQRNDWITPDMLSVKTSIKTKECDAIMASLVAKKYVEYVSVNEAGKMTWRTSLEPLNQILLQQFSNDVARSNQNGVSAQRASDLETIYAYFEKKLNKTLSPFDKDAINQWLDDGYRVQQIEDALEMCLIDGKKTVKAIGRRLKMTRAGDDFDREGYTAVSSGWNKTIEETLAIANASWVDDGNE